MTVNDGVTIQELRLIGRIRAVNRKLAELPSPGWAKDAANRKRAELAAQKRNLEAALIALRQIPLFPKNQRQGGENA
jgi:hypothetical protein